MSEIRIYVDGACHPNPGIGGYAFVVVEDDVNLHQYSRRVEDTTNNRMEMSAIEDALQWVIAECPKELVPRIVIYTDSKYCYNGITHWCDGWERKNWQDVKNSDIWQNLKRLSELCPHVRYKWVKGHDGDRWNEHVDKLAVSARMAK